MLTSDMGPMRIPRPVQTDLGLRNEPSSHQGTAMSSIPSMSNSAEPLSQAYVAEVFHSLEVKGKAAEFGKFVADDVDWVVEGGHPVAGKYNKAEFQVNILL